MEVIYADNKVMWLYSIDKPYYNVCDAFDFFYL